MGSRWQKKRKKEHYYKKAKKEGYRSRAAYKLKQLNERYNLIHSGDTIVDLGAAPGGWLQVARELTGEKGFVLGVDLDEIEEIPAKNIKTIQGDITEEETIENIQNELPDSPDVILSDVSPNISGIWDVDQARSVDLSRTALNIGREILRPGGRMLIKVFQGKLFQDFVGDVERSFSFTTISKPEASRKRSAETYVIGKGFSPD